jgi:guanine nucleotide-binding protein G(i) subunit alpha
MRKLGVDPVDPVNRVHAERIAAYILDSDPKFVISEDICKAIDSLWKVTIITSAVIFGTALTPLACRQDPIIPTVMDHTSEFYLMDSAPYFFSEVLRIGAPDYIPDVADALRVRQKTTGIFETRYARHLDVVSRGMLTTPGPGFLSSS